MYHVAPDPVEASLLLQISLHDINEYMKTQHFIPIKISDKCLKMLSEKGMLLPEMTSSTEETDF
jgi:hypothetical protein